MKESESTKEVAAKGGSKESPDEQVKLTASPTPSKTKPATATAKAKPATEAAKAKPATKAAKAKPATEAAKAKPATEAAKAKPATEAAKAEPAAKAAKAEPAAKAAKAEPAAKAAKAEPATEAAKPEPATEAAKAKPATEAAKAEPATAEAKAESAKSETAVEPAKETQSAAEGAEPDTEEQQDEESSMEDMVTGITSAASGLTSAASGWLSGWMKSLEVAKDKSAEVYDMVKKDLSEFTEAVQTETSSMLSDTSTMISSTSQTLKESLKDEASTAGQVKKSVSGFLTHVHKAFTPDTAQDDDAEAYVLQDGQPVLLDRLQTELYRLSENQATYLTEPAESERVRYEVWSAEIDLEARQAELSDLLASNKAVLEEYTQLVPAKVSHDLFWHRYLFRVHLAEEKEKQREQLRKRADQMASPGQAEKQITWEEEDFSHHVEVTDAQADQLLAEYEAEKRQKPKKAAATAAPGTAAAAGEERPGSRSPGRSSASNEDDWVKADMDAETNSSVGNDWEKWD